MSFLLNTWGKSDAEKLVDIINKTGFFFVKTLIVRKEFPIRVILRNDKHRHPPTTMHSFFVSVLSD